MDHYCKFLMYVDTNSNKSHIAFKKYKKQTRRLAVGFGLLCDWPIDLLCNTQNTKNIGESGVFEECSSDINCDCFDFLYWFGFDVEI